MSRSVDAGVGEDGNGGDDGGHEGAGVILVVMTDNDGW